MGNNQFYKDTAPTGRRMLGFYNLDDGNAGNAKQLFARALGI